MMQLKNASKFIYQNESLRNRKYLNELSFIFNEPINERIYDRRGVDHLLE